VATLSSANSTAYNKDILYDVYAGNLSEAPSKCFDVTTLQVIVEVMMYHNAEHAYESGPQGE
jgi:hypothetical protein